MKIFVTGTDTDVGKTLVCAWLALHLEADYWKPIQCGLTDGEGDSETVQRLSRRRTYPERYRFALPRSPHVAAAAEATAVDLATCIPPTASRLIVEGAGGVFVPLNERELMIDLMVQIGYPVIVVARGILGGINHLLLTLAALRERRLPILGVVFTGPVLPETLDAVERYGKSVTLAHLPQLQRVDFPTLQSIAVPELIVTTAKRAER